MILAALKGTRAPSLGMGLRFSFHIIKEKTLRILKSSDQEKGRIRIFFYTVWKGGN